MHPVRIQGTSTNLRTPCGPAAEAQERELLLAFSWGQLPLGERLSLRQTFMDQGFHRNIVHSWDRVEYDDPIRGDPCCLRCHERDGQRTGVRNEDARLCCGELILELLRGVCGIRASMKCDTIRIYAESVVHGRRT